MGVSISKGNSKMGCIQSVSLPAIKTCRKCACHDKCYAHKLERIRPNVKAAYENNLQVLLSDPDEYWRDVEATIMMSRFFRFHVSGDIPYKDYLDRMVEVAERNEHCRILCFTKRYEMVYDKLNELREYGRDKPDNLQLILSAWKGLEMYNPYKLPEAHVIYRDGSTTARPDAFKCTKNCVECAEVVSGCWYLKNGEQVVFDEH